MQLTKRFQHVRRDTSQTLGRRKLRQQRRLPHLLLAQQQHRVPGRRRQHPGGGRLDRGQSIAEVVLDPRARLVRRDAGGAGAHEVPEVDDAFRGDAETAEAVVASFFGQEGFVVAVRDADGPGSRSVTRDILGIFLKN